MALGLLPAWTSVVLLVAAAAVVAPLPLLWVVEADRTRRWKWFARHWNGRPSAQPVGVRSRRELLHLPADLEAITVEAQRIRRRLEPPGPLGDDALWDVWDWLRRLHAFEQRDAHALPGMGISAAGVNRQLSAALADPCGLRQLVRIDHELWTFIRAARHGARHGYR